MSDKLSSASFLADVSGHTMTVIKDDGQHRHLRFRNNGSFNQAFEIITWPGYLAIVGDMGDYVFARITDMFEFFRGNSINLSYWAEKVQASGREGVKEYSEEIARAWVKEQLDEYEASDDVREQADGLYYDNGEVRLYDQIGTIDFHGFADHWEANFKDYTHHYRWCCFAIVWAIKQYDAAKAPSAGQFTTAAQRAAERGAAREVVAPVASAEG